MLYDTLCTYRGAVVGLRGAVVGVMGAAVGVRGAAVGVRGAAVGNIDIPAYVISRGAVVRQPLCVPNMCANINNCNFCNQLNSDSRA